MLRDLVRELGRNHRLDRNRPLRHGAGFFSARRNVIEQQYAHLIAAHEFVLAVRCPHRNADAVRIRIRREHQIRAGLLCECKSLLERLKNLGVRIGAGREVAVRILLFFDYRHILDADVFQDTRHRHETGSVQRRVDEL